MSASSDSAANAPEATPRHTALFTGLVLQQASLASAFLGEAPNPETGRLEVNLDAACLFIDTLEMLEAKTRGHLTASESALLTETLTRLRLAFVQVANAPAQPTAPAASSSPAPASAPTATGEAKAPASETAKETEGSSGKRFVKRY